MISSKKTECGFTFFEILAVLVILAIALAIGILNFKSGKRSADLRLAARELFSDLDLCRSYAKSGSNYSTFTFDDPTINKINIVSYSITDTNNNVRKTANLPQNVKIDYSSLEADGNADGGFNGSAFRFRSNGSSTVKDKVGTEGIKISCDGIDKFFNISINSSTGLVRLIEH
jgi:prepilin-type N-terminal cleavage/methylation domain-containing protein